MSINDGTYGDFANELQDEDQMDAHPVPGSEIGYDTQRDCGSGSYAEDGRREVREDEPIMDGENMLGSAAMYGPTEIGDDAIGAAKRAVIKAAAAVKHAPPHVAAKHIAAAHQAVAKAHRVASSGPYASHGAVEIGAGEDTLGHDSLIGAAAAADRPGSELGYGPYSSEGATEIGAGEDTLGHDALMQPFETFMLEDTRLGTDIDVGAAAAADRPGSELGSAAMYGPTEIGEGWAAAEGASEIGDGPYAAHGAHEIGAAAAADRPGTELGAEYPTNGLSEMGDEDMGAGWYAAEGASEIGVKAAVAKVVEKARDNRQPAPPMKAVDIDAPIEEHDDFLSDIVIGAAATTGKDAFPLLSQLLVRAGAGMEPRIVRVDTEASYKDFRAAQSPALSEVRSLREKIEAHITDPNAHEVDSEDIDDDISDLVHLGEQAKAVEAEKRIDMWMPKRYDGKVEAWKQGDTVCASMALPGPDGSVRICTSFEPIRKCVEEMVRHASETSDGAVAVGVLPEMGCMLGAGTIMKEMAAGAAGILARPEAQVKLPFVVRLEPKIAPNLAALVMLAAEAHKGSIPAQGEWKKLAGLSAPPVKKAMLEALTVAKAATEGC